MGLIIFRVGTLGSFFWEQFSEGSIFWGAFVQSYVFFGTCRAVFWGCFLGDNCLEVFFQGLICWRNFSGTQFSKGEFSLNHLFLPNEVLSLLPQTSNAVDFVRQNIFEAKSTIQIILYSFRPIRLQIFCTIALTFYHIKYALIRRMASIDFK